MPFYGRRVASASAIGSNMANGFHPRGIGARAQWAAECTHAARRTVVLYSGHKSNPVAVRFRGSEGRRAGAGCQRDSGYPANVYVVEGLSQRTTNDTLFFGARKGSRFIIKPFWLKSRPPCFAFPPLSRNAYPGTSSDIPFSTFSARRHVFRCVQATETRLLTGASPL